MAKTASFKPTPVTGFNKTEYEMLGVAVILVYFMVFQVFRRHIYQQDGNVGMATSGFGEGQPEITTSWATTIGQALGRLVAAGLLLAFTWNVVLWPVKEADGIEDKRGFAVWVSFLVLILAFMASQNNTIASQKAVVLGYEEAMGAQGATIDGPTNANLAQKEEIKVCREELEVERNKVDAQRAEIRTIEETDKAKKLEVTTEKSLLWEDDQHMLNSCRMAENGQVDAPSAEHSLEKKGIGHVISKWFWFLAWVFWHVAGIFLRFVMIDHRFPDMRQNDEERLLGLLVVVLVLGLALQMITTPVAALTSCLLSVCLVDQTAEAFLDPKRYESNRQHVFLYVYAGLLAEFLVIIIYLVVDQYKA